MSRWFFGPSTSLACDDTVISEFLLDILRSVRAANDSQEGFQPKGLGALKDLEDPLVPSQTASEDGPNAPKSTETLMLLQDTTEIQQFHAAAAQCRVDDIKEQVAAAGIVDIATEGGLALTEAAYQDFSAGTTTATTCFETLQVLVNLGADRNFQDQDGDTALHLVSRTWQAFPDLAFKAISLLATDTNKNLQGEDLFTPLTHVVKFWIHSSGIAKQAIELLLTKDNVNIQTVEGMAALHYVCDFWLEPQHSLAAIKLLVEGGADRNLQDEAGSTPSLLLTAHWAPNSQDRGCAETIVEAFHVLVTPENRNLATVKGRQPLMTVACLWHPSEAALSALQVLLSPENKNSQDEAGSTALHYVVRWIANVNIAQKAIELIATDVNIDILQVAKLTPAHLLVTYWHHHPKEALKVLPRLVAGKAKNIQDENGATPLCIVAKLWVHSPHEALKAIAILRTDENVNMHLKTGHLPVHWVAFLWSGAAPLGLEALKLTVTEENKNIKTWDMGWMAVHKVASLWSGTEVYAEALKLMWTPENLNAQDQAGNSVLHIVAELAADMDLVLFFASQPGVDCNQMNKVGERPLHMAARNEVRNGVEDVHLILKCSGQVNSATQVKQTPLFFAGRPEVVRTLVASNAKMRWRDEALDMPVHFLARNPGRFSGVVMRELMEEDPHLVSVRNPATGLFPLHDAAMGGQPEVVKALLEAGGDVNVRSRRKQTPLHYATNPNVAHVLLDYGANLGVEDEDGRVPLQVSAQLHDLPMVQLLLSRNASRPPQAYPGVTPEIGELLSKDDSWKAIHYAAWSCDFHSTSLLLLENFHLSRQETKAPNKLTPVQLAELALQRGKHESSSSSLPNCEATWGLLKTSQDRSVEEEKETRDSERIERKRRRVDMHIALLTAISTAGYMAIHLLISQLKTLRNRGFVHQALPLIILAMTCQAGILKLVLQGNYQVQRLVAPLIGLVLYIIVIILVYKTKPGSHLEAIALSCKHRCRHRLQMEQGWQRAELTIKLLLYLGILGLEASIGVVGRYTSSSLPFFIAVTLLACSVVTGHLLTTTDEENALLVRRMNLAGATLMVGVVCVKIVFEPRNDPFGVFLLCSWTFCLTTIDYSGNVVEKLQSVSIEIAEVLHIREASSLAQEQNRFVGSLMLGHPLVAANGLEAYLGLTSAEIARGHQEGLKVMEEEVRATGNIDDIENFLYVAAGTSRHVSDIPTNVKDSLATGSYHGGSLAPDDFDTGAEGRTLADWMQLEEVKVANLTKAEFVAVRFYTSSSFPRINGPMRNRDAPGGRHPWAMVVYFLASGIKKLRSVRANNQFTEFTKRTVLWRGMKNMDMDLDLFKRRGGTEFAAMSTTMNEAVARAYCESKAPLLFKYEVTGMRAGVSVQFLSLYPKEEEYLYPPLTFMTFNRQYQDDNIKVVVVEPVMS